MFRKVLALLACVLTVTLACAQTTRIDSIHVYERLTGSGWSSASANSHAWKLHQRNARHRTVKGKDMPVVHEAMALYEPQRHTYAPLPDLTHVAMVFTGGRPTALGVTSDLDRVINFTARTEYRISTLGEHLAVRALLAQLLVE